MKTSHLNAIAKARGFADFEALLRDLYITKRLSHEVIMDELEISKHTLRLHLAGFGIEKPDINIPLTLDDAKRLGIDVIAKNLSVSRATAWRWKRIILDRAREATEATRVLGADAK